MAEFCFECFAKGSGKKLRKRDYILSSEPDLCEECGEWKRVVVRVKHPRIYMWKRKIRAGFKFKNN